MPRLTARSRAPLAGIVRRVALLTALVASSCSPKDKILVDPASGLEGTPSASQLVVYPDVPIRTYAFLNIVIDYPPNSGPHPFNHSIARSDDDSLVGVLDERQTDATTVHGVIFDYTPAGAYQAFRDDGSSFQALKDYLLQPVKRWPFSQTEAYEFLDPQPFPFQTYVGRGVVDGVITPDSPITNLGRITVQPTASIDYAGRINMCDDIPGLGEAPVDSLLPMAWSAVPGAAGYWVHVYQFATGADFLGSRFPSPASLGRTLDYFMAFFPAPVTSYKIGDPVPAGGRIITRRTLLNTTDYAVRITAVNADGQLIAYPSQTGRAFFVTRDPDLETRYYVSTLGAFVVHTGQPIKSPKTNCSVPLGTALPNVKFYPAIALPPALR